MAMDIDTRLNAISPSPHVQRPEPTQHTCGKCGLPLYRHRTVLACGNGHLYTSDTSDLRPLGGVS